MRVTRGNRLDRFYRSREDFLNVQIRALHLEQRPLTQASPPPPTGCLELRQLPGESPGVLEI